MKFSEMVEQGIYPTITTFSGTLRIQGYGENGDGTYWMQAAWPNGDYRRYGNVSPDWELTLA